MLGFPVGATAVWAAGTVAIVAMPLPWTRGQVSWGAGAKRENVQKQGPPGYTEARTLGGCQCPAKHIPLLPCFISQAGCF